MVELINSYAPEHLIICTTNYSALAVRITNAGSVFLGNYTPKALVTMPQDPTIPCPQTAGHAPAAASTWIAS